MKSHSEHLETNADIIVDDQTAQLTHETYEQQADRVDEKSCQSSPASMV